MDIGFISEFINNIYINKSIFHHISQPIASGLTLSASPRRRVGKVFKSGPCVNQSCYARRLTKMGTVVRILLSKKGSTHIIHFSRDYQTMVVQVKSWFLWDILPCKHAKHTHDLVQRYTNVTPCVLFLVFVVLPITKKQTY